MTSSSFLQDIPQGLTHNGGGVEGEGEKGRTSQGSREPGGTLLVWDPDLYT
jgi:hypothetical protein